VKVRLEAEKCTIDTLCSPAFKHLIKSPSSKILRDVPRFQADFESHDKTLKGLLTNLPDKNLSPKEEVFEIKENYHQVYQLPLEEFANK